MVWELLNTVSLVKSEATKENIKQIKLIKTKNNCKKENDKILISKWFDFVKFWIEKKIKIKPTHKPRISE